MRSAARLLRIVPICLTVQATFASTMIVSQVGDVDECHPGDLADFAYTSTDAQQKMGQGSFAYGSQSPLDDAASEIVAFTHLFPSVDANDILSASLQIRVRPVRAWHENDWLTFDNGNSTATAGVPVVHHLFQVVAIADLLHGSYLPPEGAVLTIDLTNVPYRTQDLASAALLQDGPTGYMSLIPYLTDGQFDVLTFDDIAVDYSVLSMTVVPEPATVTFLAFGGLMLARRRCVA